jgi:hypothetical protein
MPPWIELLLNVIAMLASLAWRCIASGQARSCPTDTGSARCTNWFALASLPSPAYVCFPAAAETKSCWSGLLGVVTFLAFHSAGQRRG